VEGESGALVFAAVRGVAFQAGLERRVEGVVECGLSYHVKDWNLGSLGSKS
jgi:hypothetical protein